MLVVRPGGRRGRLGRLGCEGAGVCGLAVQWVAVGGVVLGLGSAGRRRGQENVKIGGDGLGSKVPLQGVARPDHGAVQDEPWKTADISTLNLRLLTETIRSLQWWSYARMVYKVNGFTDDFISWAEGCECHAFLRRKKKAGDDRQPATMQERCSAEAIALEESRKHLGLTAGEGDRLLKIYLYCNFHYLMHVIIVRL